MWGSPGLQVLFYCHYPDMLLASRRSMLRRLYRVPCDWAEELSTGAADHIVVNSKFTRGGCDIQNLLSKRASEPASG